MTDALGNYKNSMAVRRSDIDACPLRSLAPTHWTLVDSKPACACPAKNWCWCVKVDPVWTPAPDGYWTDRICHGRLRPGWERG